MFLLMDGYFINLAQVNFIGKSEDTLETAYGGVKSVELWIYMVQEGSDPVPLPYTFQSEELADKYTEALLRLACTMGALNQGDMDRLYQEVIK